MKILIVAYEVSIYSSGAAVNKIIAEGLAATNHEIALLSSRIDSSSSFSCRLQIPSRGQLPSKLAKLITVVFGLDLKYIVWIVESYFISISKIKTFNPDIVYALGSSGKGCVLHLSDIIARSVHKPLAIHLVDPIPPPSHYEPSNLLRRRTGKTVQSALKHACLLSINNERMLEYQQEHAKCNIISKSIIIPDPISEGSVHYFGPTSGTKVVLIYLGTLTQARNPGSLILGFAQYHASNPNSELRIIGHNRISLSDYDISERVMSSIKFLDWIPDVNCAYAEASILVDVDADADDDIFTSHKIKKYLAVDRVILLITSTNSPSAQLFRRMTNSIVICSHKPDNVGEAICKASEITYDPFVFKERNGLLNWLRIDNAVSRIVSCFTNILEKDDLQCAVKRNIEASR